MNKRTCIAKLRPMSLGMALWVSAFGAEAQLEPVTVRVEKVEVTGSNIKRLDAETALPLTTLSRSEIEKTGANTAAELLDKISAFGTGGYNVSRGLGDGLRSGLSAVSLRGLGSSNTLVLLNGRRLSNFPFNTVGGGSVNVDQIPLAAVERVEVLKDGASAVYGTDAIGGVVNFILRKDYQGAEVSAFGLQTDRGGASSRKYTATAGFGDLASQRFNVLATLDYQKDTALGASQREFASTAIRPDLAFARTSGNVFPANFRFGGVNNNTTASQGCVPSAGSFQVNQFTGAPAPLQSFCRYDFTSVLEIYPPAERKGFFVRGAFQLAADHQVFAEYHRSRNEITFTASETPVADFSGNGPILYPAGGPYYPATVTLPDGRVIRPTGDLSIQWRLKAAGRRTDRIDNDEGRLVAGFQGIAWGWDYNTAVSRATSNANNILLDGYVRESTLRQAIATGLIDVFSANPQTPEAMALIEGTKIRQNIRESDAAVTSIDAKASRELWQGTHGPVALAMGFERRREEIEERPEEVLFTGDILGGNGPLPPTTHAERTITSAFIELSVAPLRNVEVQLAARYDRFSDFGNTINPKVALRWNPAKEWLLRASYGTGFRAPTPTDLFLPPIDGFTAGEYEDPARCPNGEPIGDFVRPEECFQQFAARYGGNRNAQPEKSRQWTLGVVFEPSRGVSLGLDYWTIRRRDSLQLAPEEAIFGSYAANDPVSAGGRIVRQLRLPSGGCEDDGDVPTAVGAPCPIDYVIDIIENVGKYNTTGIDVSGTFRIPTDYGTFTFRGEGTYYLRYRYQNEKDGPYIDNVGLSTFDNGVVTRWRHYATLGWRSGPWGVTLAHNFILGNRDQGDPPRRVASYESWDVQGIWEGWKGLKVTAGVRNLFDRDPPASRNSNTFQVGYDPRYYDPRGRTFVLGLTYTFK